MKSQPLSKTSKKSIWLTKPLSCEVIVTTKNIKSLILKYKDGAYHLSKPAFMSDQKAIEWLESLSLQQFNTLKSAQKLKQGLDFIYIFGKRYNLKKYDLNIPKVLIKDNEVCVYHKKYLEIYLKELLKQYIERRIQELKLVNFNVKVEIQNMSSKYGCCFYTQQRIKFATKLIHEPKEVIDSIIIHELAHFYYPNHQKDFYRFVHYHDKNYDLHQAYLKKGGVGDDSIG